MANSDELTKATTGYNAAINLWKLASEQIYSRYSAMLTTNSIFVAIVGVILINKDKVTEFLSLPFIIVGIGMCILWLFFIKRGLSWEKHYMDEARKLEGNSIPANSKIVPTEMRQPYRYSFVFYLTTITFIVLYVVLLIYVSIQGKALCIAMAVIPSILLGFIAGMFVGRHSFKNESIKMSQELQTSGSNLSNDSKTGFDLIAKRLDTIDKNIQKSRASSTYATIISLVYCLTNAFTVAVIPDLIRNPCCPLDSSLRWNDSNTLSYVKIYTRHYTRCL